MSSGSSGSSEREPSGGARSTSAYSRRRVLGLVAAGLGLAAGAAVVDALAGKGPIATGPVVAYPRIESLSTSTVFRVFAGDQEISCFAVTRRLRRRPGRSRVIDQDWAELGKRV
jgi:hypothetical protein